MVLEGIKESSPVLCKKFGMVLGELAAIDPEQLQIIAKAPVHKEFSEIDMGIYLIRKYLVHAYRKANTGKRKRENKKLIRKGAAQDRAAYSIQEILKFLGCDQDTPNLGQKKQKDSKQKRFAPSRISIPNIDLANGIHGESSLLMFKTLFFHS